MSSLMMSTRTPPVSAGRRRTKSPVPLARLVQSTTSISCEVRPEPTGAIIKPAADRGFWRAQGSESDHVSPWPTPKMPTFNDHFQGEASAQPICLEAAIPKVLKKMRKDPQEVETSESASEVVSPYSFPDDPHQAMSQNRAGLLMLEDDTEDLSSQEFSLACIIAERSRDGSVDDQIKQHEIQRMKECNVVDSPAHEAEQSVFEEQQPRPVLASSRNHGLPSRGQGRKRETQRRAESMTNGGSLLVLGTVPKPLPRPNSKGRRWQSHQEDEDLLLSESLHRIIAEKSHGVASDDLIKEQEIRRMKGFKDSQSLAQPAPEPKKVRARKPHERFASIPRIPQHIASRATASNQEEDHLSSESLLRIIAERSHAGDADDAIKQQEIQRMKGSMTSSLGVEEPTTQQDHHGEKSRVSRVEEEDDRIKQQEDGQALLNQIVAERARAANADTGPLRSQMESNTKSKHLKLRECNGKANNENSRRPRPGMDVELNKSFSKIQSQPGKENGEDVDILSLVAWRSQQPDAAGGSSATAVANSTNATASRSVASQVDFNSQGQPMTKNKLPAASKRPGAYSGAPGSGYKRNSSLRFESLRTSTGSTPDSTDATEGSASYHNFSTHNNLLESNQENENESQQSKGKVALEKKKSIRKNLGKAARNLFTTFRFVGRLRRAAERRRTAGAVENRTNHQLPARQFRRSWTVVLGPSLSTANG